ncbi:MAG: hypothetical protein J6U04_05045 [Salinivirgaceae bacterium]|nr:hypothetical protein [Salinivirgaceae bacterium]
MYRIFSRGRANHTKAVPTIGEGRFFALLEPTTAPYNNGTSSDSGVTLSRRSGKVGKTPFLSKKRKKPYPRQKCP